MMPFDAIVVVCLLVVVAVDVVAAAFVAGINANCCYDDYSVGKLFYDDDDS